MAYATTADLASHLQQDVDIATANLALDGASARIDSVTRGWRFLPVAPTTVNLRGGSDVLRLQRPVTAVTSVSSTSLGLVTAHAVNVDYEVVGSELRWLGRYVWPQNLSVTYSRGMATVPADIKEACLWLAGLRYTSPTGEGGERIDDYVSPSRPTAPNEDPEERILARVRRTYPSTGLSVPLVRA